MRTVTVMLTALVFAFGPAGPSAAGDAPAGLTLESELDLGGLPYRFKLRVGREDGISLRGEVDAGGKRYRLRLNLDADGRDGAAETPRSDKLERI